MSVLPFLCLGCISLERKISPFCLLPKNKTFVFLDASHRSLFLSQRLTLVLLLLIRERKNNEQPSLIRTPLWTYFQISGAAASANPLTTIICHHLIDAAAYARTIHRHPWSSAIWFHHSLNHIAAHIGQRCTGSGRVIHGVHSLLHLKCESVFQYVTIEVKKKFSNYSE